MQNESDDGEVQYRIVEVDEKIKKTYEHVNDSWLQAQLNMERKMNIRPIHSVGNFFINHLFKNQKFYIAPDVFGNKKEIKN